MLYATSRRESVTSELLLTMRLHPTFALAATFLTEVALAAGPAAMQKLAAAAQPEAAQQRSACPAGYDFATIQAMRPEESGYGVILTLRGPKVNRDEGVLHAQAQRLALRVGGPYCAKSSVDDLVEETEVQALQRAQQRVRQYR